MSRAGRKRKIGPREPSKNAKGETMPKPMIDANDARTVLSYDHETGTLTWLPRAGSSPISRSFNSRCAGRVAGAKQGKGYLTVEIFRRKYLAHRVAWLIYHGVWPTDQLDHIDGDKANNKLSNLRPCTNSENSQNKWLSRINTSGVPGVSRDRRTGRWEVRLINRNGVRKRIGSFVELDEARRAYIDAKRSEHLFQPTHRYLEGS